MHGNQVIKDIRVVGVDRPQKYKFSPHFEYVIRVTYVNGHEHLIFRRYSMLFDFHSVLKEVVKDTYSNIVVLPELPVARFQHVGRKFLRLGMNKELKQMTEFCQKIIQLPNFISEKDIILKFFDQLGTDVAYAETYLEQSQKVDLPKEQSDTPSSPAEGPGGDSSRDNENHYRSVAEFEASGTGELSVTCGEVVTVIEKNSSGWWLVSNAKGKTGFTPATFLEPLEETTNNEEEWVEVKGPHSIYTAVRDYEAQCPDEISFKAGEELAVISMSNFGWWKVRRGNEIGLCPASSLAMKNAQESSASNFDQDPMNEFRRSVLILSKKSSHRGAPPRKSSKRSIEDEFSEPGHIYGNVQRSELDEKNPEQTQSSVNYTKVIPKHLRETENTDKGKDSVKPRSSYVNVAVIKGGIPHYFEDSQGEETEAINVHVVRKNYEGKGLTVKEGETVQVIAVMPDGCHWKVATINPPFRDGLIPADLLCPESSHPIEKPQSPSDSVGDSVIFDGESTENRQPLKVLPRFTKPPSVKKPIPKARAAAPRSPTVPPKGISVVALEDYHPPQNDSLAFKKGDKGRLIKKEESGWWFIELNGFEGWVPNVYWEEVEDTNGRKIPHQKPVGKVFDQSQWFYGRMSRVQCEDRFAQCGKHLDFIVRESIQRVGSFVLSVKFNDKVHHFPIEKTPSGKLKVGARNFDQLSEVVSYYTVHPLFYTDFRQPVSIGKPLSVT